MTAARFDRVLPVHIPTVQQKGPHDTDADRFLRAAANLEKGFDVGGSHTRAAVARLLRGAASALEANNQPDPEWSFHRSLSATKATAVSE